MTEKEKSNFKIIDSTDELKKSVSEIQAYSKDNKHLAVDCEGINLSRTGKLTILTIATKDKVYIFDVLKLGRSGFDEGLRNILEDKSIEKLLFDCRNDADSLWHQFSVKLNGVLDLQLLEVLHRRRIKSSIWDIMSEIIKRNQKVDHVEHIAGYQRCLELYVGESSALRDKKKGKFELDKDGLVWSRRPLSDTLAKYCCADVTGLFQLYDALMQNEDIIPRLRVASERYADRYRSMTDRNYDKYECNAYLPLEIIPEKGRLDFPSASTPCSKCNRKFPHDEFLPAHLSRGIQKCCVCRRKEIDISRNYRRGYRF